MEFVAQLLTWLKPHLSPLFAWSSVTSPGMVGRLPDTVILTLHYIAAEMYGETFLISAKRPVHYNAEQFRTDAKCTQDIIVLGGWELESKRWFSLKLDRTQVPYLFKPDGGGAQWASTSAELSASLCALVAFGWLSPTTARRTVAWAAAFSRCGNVFFPLRQLFGLQSWTFSAAGFFPASAGFFLASDGFFPASDGFFPAASKMHFFCCKGAFVLLQGVFSAALNFSRCEAAFFAGIFSRCGNSFFPLQGVFSPAAKRVFFRSDVFFLLRTCVFPALREDKELENVESYTGRSPLVSWIAHGQVGEEGDQTLKQPSANEKLKRAAVDAATCFNGSGYKRERQNEEEKAEER